MDIKKRLIRTAILALIGLGIGAGIALYQIKNEPAIMPDITIVQSDDNEPAATSAAVVSGVQLGGDFTLTNQDGQTVTQEDYADKFKLIYFGFTYCPAICPTELQKMAAAMGMLETDVASQIQQLFISVDPERDTVEIMRPYVELFHSDLVGLTGTNAQIEDIKKKYKVFATKVQDEAMSYYTIDHSSFIYLMSKDNKPLMIFRMDDNAEMIAAEIRKVIKGDF